MVTGKKPVSRDKEKGSLSLAPIIKGTWARYGWGVPRRGRHKTVKGKRGRRQRANLGGGVERRGQKRGELSLKKTNQH